MAKRYKRRALAGVKQIHSTPGIPKALKVNKWGISSRNYFYRIFDKIGKQLNEANKAELRPGEKPISRQFHRSWDFA